MWSYADNSANAPNFRIVLEVLFPLAFVYIKKTQLFFVYIVYSIYQKMLIDHNNICILYFEDIKLISIEGE